MATKWTEDPRIQKLFSAIRILSLVAYLLLTLFEALSRPLVPKPVPYVFMGIVFLSQAMFLTGKKRIWDYILAAVWFAIAVLYCF